MIATAVSIHCSQDANVHRLGDGLHPLPVYCLGAKGLEQVTSEGCVLYLFLCWAQDNDVDACEIFARAHPDETGLRPDHLLIYRAWTEIPEAPIDVDLLCSDLQAIGRHRLAEVILQITSESWRPELAFSHWLVTNDGVIAGEARELDPINGPDSEGQRFGFVRLFAMPECAEWGYTNECNLTPKRLRCKEITHAPGTGPAPEN